VSNIDEWRRIRSITNRSDFVALHPYVFLVSAPERGTAEFTPLTKPTEFRTVTHKQDVALPQRGQALQPPETPLILPLRKADGHPFPERISIGRANNCDLVIRDPSVSKLHGHFRDVGPESALFTDAKSANGTRVDGTQIKPGEAIEIRRHALLSFGRVQLMLISAEDAYDWL
jgi:pSer/pThr/pTyr-binding forkhead associated (FHA) protein